MQTGIATKIATSAKIIILKNPSKKPLLIDV